MDIRPFNKKTSLVLLIFAGMGILALIGAAGLLASSTLINYFTPQSLPGSAFDSESFSLAVSLVFCAGLLVPTVYFAFKRLKGQPVAVFRIPPIRFWQLAVLLVGWIAAMLIGNFLDGLFGLSWLITPVLGILVITFPWVMLVWLSLGGLAIGSRQRGWGTLSMGMLVSTTVSGVMELLAGLALLIAAGLLALVQPSFFEAIQYLNEQISMTTEIDVLLSRLTPLLMNPAVIALAVLAFAVVIPLIEESAKGIIVLLFRGRLRSPAQGFALGALSGAGFALLEGLIAANGSGDWGALIIARAGGSGMHVLASAVLGWAIASAHLEKRPARLVAFFAASVGLHSVWNAATLLILYGSLQMLPSGAALNSPALLATLGGLLILLLLCILSPIALALINRRLRRGLPDSQQMPKPGI